MRSGILFSNRWAPRLFPFGLAFLAVLLSLFLSGDLARGAQNHERPNILLVFADQWRFEAFGYAGNPDVKTPNIDRLQREGISFVNAVASTPVCSPYRASLLTGQHPLTHGVFLNDVPLRPEAVSFGDVLSKAGYATGWIGKWHVDGHGRSEFIPRERRQGFDYWKVLECTHNYNDSAYFADEPVKLKWRGYDAIAQTRDAQQYIRDKANTGQPFALVLSWGPPHDPYFTAPESYRALYNPERLTLRPNVPPEERAKAARILAGYYAHCTALDDSFGDLRRTLAEEGIEDNTILIFTSDHGDMLGSHGLLKKQKPFDESIRVPFLIRWPAGLGTKPRKLECPLTPEDIMPTMLDLAGIAIPGTCEGINHAGYLRGRRDPCGGAAVIQSITPFGEWERAQGGREYRGLRTSRYTYVRDLKGPWLLFDNKTDPYQTNNLMGAPSIAKLQASLEKQLGLKLKERGDEFLAGEHYIARWGYTVNERGTVPYRR
jgi:arylsulfatase A-like enzyme